MDMEKTIEMPIVVNDYLKWKLPRAAKQFVDEFKGGVYPILHRFNLLDDEHIQKYIHSTSLEDIYTDVLRDNPEAIRSIEQDALFEPERDVWRLFRFGKSPKSPSEEGFVFGNMPLYDYSNRKVIIKALSVRNLEILIDEEFLLNSCIVRPNEQQKELWALLSEFCEKFNEAGFNKKWVANHLFIHDSRGIRPNLEIILGRYDISRKR